MTLRRTSIVGARAFAGLVASGLVRHPAETIRGFIGSTQFSMPPRSIRMRSNRRCELPQLDLATLSCTPRERWPSDFLLVLDGREAWVHLPSNAHASLPLIVNFHGFTSDAQEHAEYTQMAHVATRHGFAVVHPQGAHGFLGYRAWNAGPLFMNERVDDEAFIRTLLDGLGALLPVSEYFATGISNGGMMAYRMAHAFPGLFSAIAPVAAIDTTDAPIPKQPLGVFHIHGTNDGLLPFQEAPFRMANRVGDLRYPRSARESLLRFVGHGGAPEVRGGEGRRYEIWQSPGRPTVQLLLHSGGHTWLGDGYWIMKKHAQRVVAGSEEIVRFFIAHARSSPLPR